MAWGLCLQPSSPVPAAIAPEVTRTTSTPAFRRAASSRTKRASRRSSRCPPARVSRLVPILTTKRFTLGFIGELDIADAHVVPRDRPLAGQLALDPHLLQYILKTLQTFKLLKVG